MAYIFTWVPHSLYIWHGHKPCPMHVAKPETHLWEHEVDKNRDASMAQLKDDILTTLPND